MRRASSLDRIAPKLSRISIREGWKRLFGVQGFAEFLKSLGKLAFASAFLMFAVSEAQHRLLLGMITQPGAFSLVIREIAINILLGADLRHADHRRRRHRLVALQLEARPAHDASRR